MLLVTSFFIMFVGLAVGSFFLIRWSIRKTRAMRQEGSLNGEAAKMYDNWANILKKKK